MKLIFSLLLYLIILISGCVSEKETLITKKANPPDLCSKGAIELERKGDTCKKAKRNALIGVLEEAAETLIDRSSDIPDSRWYGLVFDNSNYNFFFAKKLKLKL